MTTPDLVLGLDSSTTGCKAVIFDRAGGIVAMGRAAIPLLKPRPGWHEQPSDAWWAAAVQALRESAAQVDAARLAAMSISIQRETFVVVDQQGRPLMNALVWMDERARDLLPEIDQIYGRERVHQETGKPLSGNLTLAKLFWMQREAPEIFAKIACVLDVHAYLAQKLTGRAVTSWGCADPGGLFDMRHNAWDADLIAAIGMRVEQFPEAAPVGAVIGRVSAEAARECGLPEGLPLVAGIGDGQAAELGVCAVEPGEACLNLGTAVVTGTFSPEYRVDRAFRTHYSAVPGAFELETVLLGGTYTVSWFVEQFGKTIEEMERAAAEIPPGAEGLLLVPYWNTALNPYWDASASGITVGWRGIHGPAHLYRAILEGIAFELRLSAEGVGKSMGRPVERLIAVGGGARSPLWCQIIADVTGRDVFRAESADGSPDRPAPLLVEASALGAGILAASGTHGSHSLYPDTLTAARAMTRRSREAFHPDGQRHNLYSWLYEGVYQGLYPALRESLRRLAGMDANAGPR